MVSSTSVLLVLVVVGVALAAAAPSNSTSGSNKPKPKSGLSTTSTTSSTPIKGQKVTGQKAAGGKNSTSSRVTRDLAQVAGNPSSSASNGLKNINVNRGVVQNRTVLGSLKSVVRRSPTSESDESDAIVIAGTPTKDTSHSIPSSHPLFANRQSSNITAALKPKLRSPSSSSSSNSSHTSDRDPSSILVSSHVEEGQGSEAAGAHPQDKSTEESDPTQTHIVASTVLRKTPNNNSTASTPTTTTGGNKRRVNPQTEEQDV